MDALYELRIVDGPVAYACWVLGLGGAGTLLILATRPRRSSWPRSVAISAAAVVAAAMVTGLVHWLLVDIANVFPEDLPAEVLTAGGFGILGIVLAVVGVARLGVARRAWGRRAVAVVSAAATSLLSTQVINAYFGLNLTVADLAGVSVSDVQPLESALERPGAPAVPLAAWKRTNALPPNGELRSVQIPAPSSGFKARPAYVYLPPAYFAPTRPELPVLLLV